MKRGRKPRDWTPPPPPCAHPNGNRIDPTMRVFACPDCHHVVGIVRVVDWRDEHEETIQAS